MTTLRSFLIGLGIILISAAIVIGALIALYGYWLILQMFVMNEGL